MVSEKIIISTSSISFYEVFVQPWLNPFAVLVGLFFSALCAFLAAVLLIGEANPKERKIYVKKARIANIVVIVFGFLVLSYGIINDLKFVTDFLNNQYAMGFVSLSALLLLPLTYSIKKATKVKSRFLAGIQVVLILLAAIVYTLSKFGNSF